MKVMRFLRGQRGSAVESAVAALPFFSILLIFIFTAQLLTGISLVTRGAISAAMWSIRYENTYGYEFSYSLEDLLIHHSANGQAEALSHAMEEQLNRADRLNAANGVAGIASSYQIAFGRPNSSTMAQHGYPFLDLAFVDTNSGNTVFSVVNYFMAGGLFEVYAAVANPTVLGTGNGIRDIAGAPIALDLTDTQGNTWSPSVQNGSWSPSGGLGNGGLGGGGLKRLN